ncbi:MAG: hypothetical protein HC868_09345 [Sphingomonadales bacterium]|nr:hypothetical protein [Sphingomonadales bacterium]
MNRKTDDRDDNSIASFGGRDGLNAQRPHNSGHLRQKLPPEVHAFLGHRLRAAYSDLVNEPIPLPLLDLLNRLKTQELENGGTGLNTNEAKEKA